MKKVIVHLYDIPGVFASRIIILSPYFEPLEIKFKIFFSTHAPIFL